MFTESMDQMFKIGDKNKIGDYQNLYRFCFRALITEIIITFDGTIIYTKYRKIKCRQLKLTKLYFLEFNDINSK